MTLKERILLLDSWNLAKFILIISCLFNVGNTLHAVFSTLALILDTESDIINVSFKYLNSKCKGFT